MAKRTELEAAREAVTAARERLEADRRAFSAVAERLAEAGAKREALLEERRGLLVAARVDADPAALARLQEQEAEVGAARLAVEDAEATAEQLRERIAEREATVEAAERAEAVEELRELTRRRRAGVERIERATAELVTALLADAALADGQRVTALRAGLHARNWRAEAAVRNWLAWRLRPAVFLEHSPPTFHRPLPDLLAGVLADPAEPAVAAAAPEPEREEVPGAVSA